MGLQILLVKKLLSGTWEFLKKVWPVLVLLAVFVFGLYIGYGRGQAASALETGELKGRVAELEGENDGLQTSCQTKIEQAETDRDEAVRKANAWSAKVEEQAAAFRTLEAQRLHSLSVLRTRLITESQEAGRLRSVAADLELMLSLQDPRSLEESVEIVVSKLQEIRGPS